VARGIFGNVLKTKGLLGILVNYRLILDKNRGLFAKWHGIFGFDLFSNGKRRELGTWFVHHGQCWSTVDRGQGLGSGSPGLGLEAALGHGGLSRRLPREGGEVV
jgi:hypothetical protein